MENRIRFTPLHLLLVCLATFPLMGNPLHANEQTQVEQAIAAYEAGMEATDSDTRSRHFQRAEQLFRQTIEESADGGNSAIWVNLGNAAMQGGRIGPAIAAFRHALQRDPGNARATQNLAYARAMLPEWIQTDRLSGFSDSFFFWTRQYSPALISLVAAICFALAVVLFAIGRINRQTLVRNLAILPFVAWAVLVASLFSLQLNSNQGNIVVVSEAILYSANSENSPTRISKPLPSGAEVKQTEDRDRWIEVELPGGTTGWILKSRTTRLDS